MTKLTKKVKAQQGKVDSNKLYPLTEALAIVKECATAKFDESIDVAVQLGIDAKKSDQVVRGAVVMPNGTGKTKRVAVFAQGAKAEGLAAAEAETARLMAPVTAQIALAEKIEKSEAYLKYLVQQLQVEAARAVGLGMTGAMEKAEIKILSGGNPGDLAGGVSNVLELFSSKGGMGIMGLMEALSQSEPGKALIQRITGKSDAATIE